MLVPSKVMRQVMYCSSLCAQSGTNDQVSSSCLAATKVSRASRGDSSVDPLACALSLKVRHRSGHRRSSHHLLLLSQGNNGADARSSNGSKRPQHGIGKNNAEQAQLVKGVIFNCIQQNAQLVTRQLVQYGDSKGGFLHVHADLVFLIVVLVLGIALAVVEVRLPILCLLQSLIISDAVKWKRALAWQCWPFDRHKS